MRSLNCSKKLYQMAIKNSNFGKIKFVNAEE